MSFLRRTLLPALFVLAPATSWSALNEADFSLKCQSGDGFLHIYADHPVPDERCRAITGRVLKAFDFVAERAGWRDRRPLTAQPLAFALVGESASNLLGFAQGPNLMVMKDSYLDKALSEGTLAHELTHIQDFRQLKGRPLPSFMLEGRALTIGHAYRMAIGQPAGDYDRQMAASAARFTAEHALALLDNDRGHGWDNQAIGTVVVEYMRSQWKGGVSDINRRLSQMIERMAGGVAFEQAFQDEFQVTADAFAETFASHLRATQGDPARRLRGTIWQSVDPAQEADPAHDAYVGDVIDLVGDLLK